MWPRPFGSSASSLPPQASAVNADTSVVRAPPGSTASSSLKLRGSDQQMNGFVADGWTPLRAARWWNAQPDLPAGPVLRLAKMQPAPSLRVLYGRPDFDARYQPRL